jgi:molecular chaperone GrpE (heat shock protein)
MGCRTSTPEAGPEADAKPPDPPPDAEFERDLSAFVTEQLAGISTQLSELRAAVDARADADDRRSQWVTQLTSELTAYRDDFVFKNVVSKILSDLISLYDTLDQTLDPAVLAGISQEDLVTRLRSVRRQVLRALERQDVELLKSEARTPFDEAWQEAIDVQIVDRASDAMIVESVRCGFRYGARLLRPESVIVGHYEPRNDDSDG